MRSNAFVMRSKQSVSVSVITLLKLRWMIRIPTYDKWAKSNSTPIPSQTNFKCRGAPILTWITLWFPVCRFLDNGTRRHIICKAQLLVLLSNLIMMTRIMFRLSLHVVATPGLHRISSTNGSHAEAFSALPDKDRVLKIKRSSKLYLRLIFEYHCATSLQAASLATYIVRKK